MATLARINTPSARFNENLLDIEQNYSVVSGGGNVSLSYDVYSFNTQQSIRLQSNNTSTTVFNIVDNSITCARNGRYAFSLRLYKVNPLFEYQLVINVFKNAVLFTSFNADINNGSGFVDGNWNTYGQTFDCLANDVITFQIEVATGNINNVMYISAMKFEFLDKIFGLPSIYSYPMDFYLNNSTGLMRIDDLGFASYTDTGYTIGAPFSVSAGVDTVLPNRSQLIYDEQKPSDIKTFYYSRRLIVGTVTGTYLEGETVTGATSGATARLIEIDANGHLLLVNQSGTWAVSETVTGATSGATSTITTIKQGAITGRDGDGLDMMLYFYAVPTNVSQTMDIWLDLTDGTGTPANLAVLYPETYEFPKGVGVARGIKLNFSSAYTRNTWQANGGRIFINSSHALTIYGINFNIDRASKAR